ncbi:MAG: methyltransferase domain-containing protein [Deltaproteobacteria bacterium]
MDNRRDPSRLLMDFIPSLTVGRALDIACGEGRNSIYLARKGFNVDAIDISDAALAKGRAAADGLKINFIAADLEAFQIPEDSYDLIINFNYLQRSIASDIRRGLKVGGYIIFETYTLEQKKFGRPTNPEFLLKPNELLTMFKDLHIIYYREGVFEEGGRKKGLASLVGEKIKS